MGIASCNVTVVSVVANLAKASQIKPLYFMFIAIGVDGKTVMRPILDPMATTEPFWL